MAQKAPGKHYRKGITLLELARMFPDEKVAQRWFENILWPNDKRYCPRCGSDDTHEASHLKMPYRCRDCRKYFSVKTGTVMAGSPLPLLKWVYAIYLDLTSLKGVSSMKLHRDLGITQKSAWHMQQRIREAFAVEGPNLMAGPVEVDESHFGGKERNKHASTAGFTMIESAVHNGIPKKGSTGSNRTPRWSPWGDSGGLVEEYATRCKKLKAGRGTVGKTAVAGAKDRATGQVSAAVVGATNAETLQGFVVSRVAEDATVYTDENRAYRGLPHKHETVNHSVGEYVDEMVHTNGVESFWSMLKRAHKGTFHKMSPKHLQRYVNEFAGVTTSANWIPSTRWQLSPAGWTGSFYPIRS